MRKILVAAMTAGLLAVAAPAFAGPGGTSEGTTADGKGDNNVDCNSGPATQRQQVPGSGIFVSADGSQTSPQSGGSLVVCNESGTNNGAPSPIQGRVIANGGTSGGYVTADGDRDNAAQAQGWSRVNIGTSPSVRCGGPADANTSNDATTNNGSQAACG